MDHIDLMIRFVEEPTFRLRGPTPGLAGALALVKKSAGCEAPL